MASAYETMRMNPENWKLGCIYVCAQDPRLVVRNRFIVGWAWNFGNPKVIFVLPAVIFLFGLPLALGYLFGVGNGFGLLALVLIGLAGVVLWAHHSSKEPSE